jgi:hypothetical protein
MKILKFSLLKYKTNGNYTFKIFNNIFKILIRKIISIPPTITINKIEKIMKFNNKSKVVMQIKCIQLCILLY